MRISPMSLMSLIRHGGAIMNCELKVGESQL